VEQNLEYLKVLGIQPVTTQVSFHFSDADAESARLRLSGAGLEPGRFFQAHVTSRWMFKTMPAATAARMLDMLRERSGLPFLLTVAPEPKERTYLEEVQRHLSTGPAPVASDLRLKELGALTSMARFFAGVDSAPMHIAAALDVPVLGVFGPSSPLVWGPWDNWLGCNPYHANRGIQQSGRHTVLQSAAACVPCLRDGCNGSKRSDCLDFPLEQLKGLVDDFVKTKVES
jgi:heptosyltransferase-3